ncbi:hypothetical protein ElyMa_000616800 [Elysia marginata]|uniref:Uncharacterized protein n=1 Tax=Elysia marginata TaxID=1093978 RepID=A0AAV4G9R7_9GAST|nr:hypothetical protein ElyMa_000616800 [Elysia marginata]
MRSGKERGQELRTTGEDFARTLSRPEGKMTINDDGWWDMTGSDRKLEEEIKAEDSTILYSALTLCCSHGGSKRLNPHHKGWIVGYTTLLLAFQSFIHKVKSWDRANRCEVIGVSGYQASGWARFRSGSRRRGADCLGSLYPEQCTLRDGTNLISPAAAAPGRLYRSRSAIQWSWIPYTGTACLSNFNPTLSIILFKLRKG